MIPFIHHFGLAKRFDILRLCFLARDILPLSGSATLMLTMFLPSYSLG